MSGHVDAWISSTVWALVALAVIVSALVWSEARRVWRAELDYWRERSELAELAELRERNERRRRELAQLVRELETLSERTKP